MKKLGIILMLFTLSAWGESPCDIRPGETEGIKVLKFHSGSTVHSKMALRDVTPDALFEEMISLQEMGVCREKIYSKKCHLKMIRTKTVSRINFLRNHELWMSWPVQEKKQAQNFVKSLIRIGFCS